MSLAASAIATAQPRGIAYAHAIFAGTQVGAQDHDLTCNLGQICYAVQSTRSFDVDVTNEPPTASSLSSEATTVHTGPQLQSSGVWNAPWPEIIRPQHVICAGAADLTDVWTST